MNPAIRTQNLNKKFHRVNALNNLNLEVPEGAIYALVGPNGAGKTTAIKILMNIFRATSGHAEVLGQQSPRLSGSAFASIGYVSENQDLPEWMSVAQFLTYLRSFYPLWDLALESLLVKNLDLPLDRKLRNLSRGMRMKAALASSLAYHPKLMVLDEPFGGLDPLVRDELIEGLLERAEETTIFISSHDLAEMESFATHVGYLDRGTLRFSEELASLSARFREIEVALEAPATLSAPLPPTWFNLDASAVVVRFVESRFDTEHTHADIAAVFSGVRDVTVTPMSLRSIFLAMAKSKQTSA